MVDYHLVYGSMNITLSLMLAHDMTSFSSSLRIWVGMLIGLHSDRGTVIYQPTRGIIPTFGDIQNRGILVLA